MQASTQMRQSEDRSIAGLFRDLMQELASLVRNETELARAEISEKVSQAGSGVASLVMAGVVLQAGLIILLLAGVYGLSLIWPQWLAALAVGGGVTLLGLILLMVARSKLQARNLTPQRTTESLRKDSAFAQEKLR